MDIPGIIEGPAIVEFGGNFYESREAIKVKVTDETDDKSVITRGVVGKRIKGRKVEVSFTPVKWSKFSALFSVLSLARSGRVFGNTNTPARIWGADGTMVTLPRAGITGIPSLGFGAGKDIFAGAVTLTGLVDPTKAFSDMSSLLSVTQEAMPSLPELTAADLSNAGFFGLLMSDASTPAAADIVIDLEEGAEISFDLKLNERRVDRVGLFDYTFDSISPKAKFKPSGATIENWRKLVNLVSGPAIGGVQSPAYDIMLRGLYAGEPQATLRRVVCNDRELTWSDTEQRYAEIELLAMGDMGLDKVAITNAAANWAPVV